MESFRLKLQIPYNKKTVLQFDKENNFIKEYESLNEAERQTGIFQTNIGKCCSKKRKTAGGYIWRLKEEI